MSITTFRGYDENTYTIGDRVELHPDCDFGMRGACYQGVVVGMSITISDQVHVTLDKLPGRKVFGSQSQFRRIN